MMLKANIKSKYIKKKTKIDTKRSLFRTKVEIRNTILNGSNVNKGPFKNDATTKKPNFRPLFPYVNVSLFFIIPLPPM